MLYIIGLGLNLDGISSFGLEVLKKCKKIYIEDYTVDFPYQLEELQEFLGKKLVMANRELVENLSIVDEAKKLDIALLVYGSPLTATTHISLIEEAKRLGIRYKVIYNASIIDAVAETGLQLYKFGKITSMPKWQKSFNPDSFMDVVVENKSINAHTLILCDIGLKFQEALSQLEEASKNKSLKIDKIIVCQALGTRDSKIFYDSIYMLKEINVRNPFCIILPSKLHFLEKEVLEGFRDY